MKIYYYKDTDSLYIDLSSMVSSDSKEVAENVVLDFDVNGEVVGIDIQNASKIIDLKTLETESLPIHSTKSA